jgi:Mrp family chromosome partitioning ATPase
MRQRTGLAWDGPADGEDEPVDVPRYLAALKRAWPLVVLLIILMTVTVLVLSLALPETYRATARIVFDDRAGAGTLETTDVETVQRRLATVQVLLTTNDVLERVGEQLPGETAETLEDKVEASVDEEANIVDVSATDENPAGAAAIANATAREFVEMEAAAERDRYARAREALQSALERVQGLRARRAEAQALRAELNDLNLSQAAGGARLRLAQTAERPSEPHAPRPVRNTIFAFFASAFIAVLAALALDQVAPRLSGVRELSRLTHAPVLAALPSPRRLRGRRRQTETAFQALQAAVLQLPPDRKVLMVTSAFASDEKSAVSLRLARSLARSGSRTLLISADFERPRIEERLRVAGAPGLADVVHGIAAGDGVEVEELVAEKIAAISPAEGVPELDVLPSGNEDGNRPRVFSREPMSILFQALERSDYRYVVVDGPPLLGVVDGPVLARYADAMVVVCRPDRMTPSAAAELGDALAQVGSPAVGLVAVGGRTVTPYSVGLGRWALGETRSPAEA